MTRTGRILVAIAVIMVGLLIDTWHYHIEERWWHWRHGYSIIVGDYVVPVPAHWLVNSDVSNGRSMTMANTHSKRGAEHRFTPDGIMVMGSPHRVNLDSWESFSRQFLEGKGFHDIEEKTLYAGNEKIVCLGGTEFRDAMHVPMGSLLSFNCMSEDGLELMYTGYRSGLDEFYSIASQIRKKQ